MEHLLQNVVDFARSIEREIGFAKAELWIKRINDAVLAEREACANLGEKLLLPETFFETTYEHDAHKDALLAYRNAIHARGTT